VNNYALLSGGIVRVTRRESFGHEYQALQCSRPDVVEHSRTGEGWEPRRSGKNAGECSRGDENRSLGGVAGGREHDHPVFPEVQIPSSASTDRVSHWWGLQLPPPNALREIRQRVAFTENVLESVRSFQAYNRPAIGNGGSAVRRTTIALSMKGVRRWTANASSLG